MFQIGSNVVFSLSGVAGHEMGGPVTTAGLMAEVANVGWFASTHFQSALSAADLLAPYATGAVNSLRATDSAVSFQSASV